MKPDLRSLEERTKASMAFIDWHSVNYRQTTTSAAPQCPANALM